MTRFELIDHIQYRKGYKKFIRSGRGSAKNNLADILEDLTQGNPINPKFNPHPLKGAADGTMAAHVKGQQWVLVYEVHPSEGVVDLWCLNSHDRCYD